MEDQPAAHGANWPSRALIVALGTILVAFLLLLPDLWRLLPDPIEHRPFEVTCLAVLAAYGILRRLSSWKWRGASRWLVRIELAAAWLLPRGLVLGITALIVVLILGWLPNYLTWPWCRDVDTFATLAMSWDQGVLPYRDIRAYNFPGHTYLHWSLGHVFGWGHTAPYYAFDALMLAALGVALAGWSRRRFDTVLPGLGAFLAYLGYALGLEYEVTAQRDLHTALLAVLALLAAESWTGNRGRVFSALAMAAALAIRPHAVLLLPALAWAIVEGLPRPLSWRSALRALGITGLWLAGLALLMFAPLLAAGIADDLARSLRIAGYGGPYSRATPASMLAVWAQQFRDPWTLFVLAACGLLALVGPKTVKSSARTWVLALLAALVYQPLHPVQHAYLVTPRELFTAVALALPLAALLAASPLSRVARLLAVLVILHQSFPAMPRHWLPRASLRAVVTLASGQAPPVAPQGAHRFFSQRPDDGIYSWHDYQAVLAYLKRTTSPTTPIANVLRRVPFPSINGPVGRLSPFRAESGICWMWLVNDDVDAVFAEELERTPKAVVVWSPDERPEFRLRLPQLVATIRKHFRPVARFGEIEVWQRRE